MPTKLVEYKCNCCQHFWEYLFHGEDEGPKECPECESNDIQNAPMATTTKLHDYDVMQEALKKRSADHSRKEISKLAGYRGTLPPKFGRRGYRFGDD